MEAVNRRPKKTGKRKRRLLFEALEERSLLSATTADLSQGALGADAQSGALVANQNFVGNIYLDFLDRTVDPAGLAHWDGLLAAGVSRQLVVLTIEQTREFAEREIETLYERYLNRSADAGGLSYYSNLLHSGVTIEQISASLAGSDEYFASQGGGTNDGFLNALYEDALGRPIDPGGLAYWTDILSLGASRTQVAFQILNTQEYRQNVVQQDYLQLLHREADPAGLSAWLTFLNLGGTDQQVKAGVAGSAEYFNKPVLTLPNITSLGTGSGLSTGAISVTVTGAAPVNSTLIVEIAALPISAVTVTDDRGNAYTPDASVINMGYVGTWIFSAPVNTALSPGDHIIAHFFAAPAPAAAVSVLSVAGLVRANMLDRTHTAMGTGTTASSGPTGATHYAEELLIGALGVSGPNTDAFTPGGGYTLVGRAGTNNLMGSNETINPEFSTVSTTGQYSADGTLGASRAWAAAIATYTVYTTPVVVQPSNQTNSEGNAAALQIVASDGDGETLTYSATGLPPGLSINASTGLITGTVRNTFANHGPYNVNVTATDTEGGSDSKSFTWSVNNIAPTVLNHSYVVTGGAISVPAPGVLAGSSDPGQETLQAVLSANVSHGTLALNSDGSFTYTAAAGFHGIDTFTFRASDGAAQSNIATAALYVDVTPSQRFISQLYLDFLDRAVDPAGLLHWDALLAAGQSRQQVALEIQQTLEFAQRQVNLLYQRYLHRNADAIGLNEFSNRLLSGVTIEQISASLAGSNEFFVTQGGGTIDGFLNAFYVAALGRSIDPAALTYWKSILSRGLTRTQVAGMILSSQEYRQDVVRQAYLQLLGREADPASLNAWVNLLNAGGTDQLVASGIAGSQEYFEKAQT